MGKIKNKDRLMRRWGKVVCFLLLYYFFSNIYEMLGTYEFHILVVLQNGWFWLYLLLEFVQLGVLFVPIAYWSFKKN